MVKEMNQGNAILAAALIPTATQIVTAIWNHHKLVKAAAHTDSKVSEVHELVNGIAERLAKARAEGIAQGIAEEQARHQQSQVKEP